MNLAISCLMRREILQPIGSDFGWRLIGIKARTRYLQKTVRLIGFVANLKNSRRSDSAGSRMYVFRSNG